jgi:hypothetical protein
MEARTLLESIMPTREMVDHFVDGERAARAAPIDLGGIMCNNALSTFDPELGWVLTDGVRSDGVDGSWTFYSYEPDGARRVANFPDRPSRIHTYGNSYTHCDQVSDGETWQEFLAAHFQEPIRNFGVGGYSVYQAYRRMLRVEAVSPAEYIILNIWDDDHYRNLDAWRSIRARRPGRFTLPHLRVNPRAESCIEIENPCTTAEEIYRLCDPDWVWENFKEDPILLGILAKESSRSSGLNEKQDSAQRANAGADARVYQLYPEAALFATRHVISLIEKFAQAQNKKLMLMLSFSRKSIASALRDEPLFDQNLLDWLQEKDYPVVDIRDAFREDFSCSRLGIGEYLEKYYNGHHSPAGNYFFAWAIKDSLCNWLDPAPLPYR